MWVLISNYLLLPDGEKQVFPIERMRIRIFMRIPLITN